MAPSSLEAHYYLTCSKHAESFMGAPLEKFNALSNFIPALFIIFKQ